MPLFGADFSGDSSSKGALRAGRASRAGTRASRIVRLVRLVRMVRIVKLYKMHGGGQDAMAEQAPTLEPSKVGKKLTEKTTRRLITMILTMVLMLPFFYVTNVKESNDRVAYHEYALKALHLYPPTDDASNRPTDAMLEHQVRTYAAHGGELLYLSVHGVPTATVKEWVAKEGVKLKERNDIFDEFRFGSAEEVSYAFVEGCFDADQVRIRGSVDVCESEAMFDTSGRVRFDAWINMAKV